MTRINCFLVKLKPNLRLVYQGTGQKRRRKSRAGESTSETVRKRKQQLEVEVDEDEMNLQRVSIIVPFETTEGCRKSLKLAVELCVYGGPKGPQLSGGLRGTAGNLGQTYLKKEESMLSMQGLHCIEGWASEQVYGPNHKSLGLLENNNSPLIVPKPIFWGNAAPIPSIILVFGAIRLSLHRVQALELSRQDLDAPCTNKPTQDEPSTSAPKVTVDKRTAKGKGGKAPEPQADFFCSTEEQHREIQALHSTHTGALRSVPRELFFGFGGQAAARRLGAGAAIETSFAGCISEKGSISGGQSQSELQVGLGDGLVDDKQGGAGLAGGVRDEEGGAKEALQSGGKGGKGRKQKVRQGERCGKVCESDLMHAFSRRVGWTGQIIKARCLEDP